MLQELQLGRPVEHQPAGKIIQVIDAMPGSVVPLAMFSVSIENHSGTPKKCFTLGLECLGHF